MKKLLWIALAALLGTGAQTLRADDIVTLDVSATLFAALSPASCSPAGSCTLAGTLVIDSTTGAIISADITGSGESPVIGPFTSFSPPGAFQGDTTMLFTDSSEDDMKLVFPTPTLGSLVGYDGGTIIEKGHSFISNPDSGATWDLNSGALTAETPEPSGWLLLGTGLIGLNAALRRLRKNPLF